MDVTVLIATRNRAASLQKTLARLASQDPGTSWEVLVCDNGSTDGTADVVRAAGGTLPVRGCVVPRPGKSHALNGGVDLAAGRLLVITDDDVVPEAGWLPNLVAASRRWPDHSIFGGPIQPLFPEEAPRWLREHDWGGMWFSTFELPIEEGPMPAHSLPNPPNLAIRATALERARFDPVVGPQPGSYPLGCELELVSRLVEAGHATLYVPSARIRHEVRAHQLDHAWLLHRCLQAGRGYVHWRPDRSSARLFGRPRWLWRAWATAWLKRLSPLPGEEVARFQARADLELLRGQIREYGDVRG